LKYIGLSSGKENHMERREFLKAAAGAMYAQAAIQRREVSIGKKRIKVIDVHGHFTAPEEADVVKGTPFAQQVANNLGPRPGTSASHG
jgi:hypothetical protein